MTPSPTNRDNLRYKLIKIIGANFERERFYGSTDKAIDQIMVEVEQAQNQLYEQLKIECREYWEKYPDANYHDLMGVITGVQIRRKLP